MTAHQLATEVVALLALQRKATTAFGPHRDAAQLALREAEQRVKKACDTILHPKQDQPTLFGNEPNTAH